MTLNEFWPTYLAAHKHPANRKLHAIGTVIAIAMLITGAVQQIWYFYPAAIILGYAFAWTGHFFVEGNRPTTFNHPILSLRADMRLCLLVVTGRFSAVKNY
jgi:hypothetical protein